MSSMEEMQAQIAQLTKQLEEKTKNEKKLSLKVSEKKCVQINGLRRFPFTFYKSEILKILNSKDDILEFIEQHDTELK